MTEAHPLTAAIAVLDAHRVSLGDAVADAAIAALRAQMPAPASVPPAEPRLRQVSILFADVADSTLLLQHLAADEALALISVALEAFAQVVRDAGGEVLRFTGDGLKAAFGTKGLREDDAERAVHAGLGILEQAAAHAARVQVSHGIARFGVRVGVHTGLVALGAGVEADRSAMGHAVHLAARMEQSAPVGSLRIGHETWALVRGLFRVEPQPPLRVKGHGEALSTFLVLGALNDPERAPQRGVDGLAPPMIGRDAELAQLLGLYEQVCRTRQPAAVCVVADAGIGKTRLRRELLQALASRTGAPATVLQARAHPSSALQPYGLVRQWVARWLGVADDLDGPTARARWVEALVARRAATAFPSTDDAAAGAERLGHLLGLDFGQRPAVQALGARELREQGRAVLAGALAAAAAQAPLVLVLDDLHWADAASLELLQQLAATASLPALWLLLTRPGSPGSTPPWARELPLAPLPAPFGEALADALLAPLAAPSPALRELLISRSEGNPYCMEELLRMLIDDGVVDTRERPWRVHPQRLGSVRVPGTLVGVLQARLDALPASDLSALQLASIIGPVFWTPALADLDAGAPSALPALQRRDTVVAREHGAFAQVEELAFRHALLHDVTYGTVLTSTRRSGHARVARWLGERLAGREGEFMAVMGDHLERAGDSAGALECYDRARLDAANRFAHAVTLKLIERELAQPALTDPLWRFQLLVNRNTSLHHQSRDDEARAAQQAMADFAEAQDDDAMRADVATARMLSADHEGRADDALALARHALALAGRSGQPTAAGPAALAHGEMAWLALLRLDFAAVDHHLALGIEQARICATLPLRMGGYRGYEAQLRTIQIDALQQQERHLECLRLLDEALASPVPTPHDRHSLIGLRFTGEMNLGRIHAASASANELLALATTMQMPRLVANSLQRQATVALQRGELDAARACAESAERTARSVGYETALPTAWWLLGELARDRGDAAGALALWDRALAMLIRQERTQDALHLRCQRARLLAPAAALAEVHAVLDTAALDPRPHCLALVPAALLDAWRVLADAGDARAPELHAALVQRLAEQLSQFDGAADAENARVALLSGVPCWTALQATLT